MEFDRCLRHCDIISTQVEGGLRGRTALPADLANTVTSVQCRVIPLHPRSTCGHLRLGDRVSVRVPSRWFCHDALQQPRWFAAGALETANSFRTRRRGRCAVGACTGDFPLAVFCALTSKLRTVSPVPGRRSPAASGTRSIPRPGCGSWCATAVIPWRHWSLRQ